MGRRSNSMSDLIDLVVAHAWHPAAEAMLLDAIAGHAAAVLASMGGGDRTLVGQAERAVRARRTGAFVFDATGSASLAAAGQTWQAGRFEPVSLGDLRHRVRQRTPGTTGGTV